MSIYFQRIWISSHSIGKIWNRSCWSILFTTISIVRLSFSSVSMMHTCSYLFIWHFLWLTDENEHFFQMFNSYLCFCFHKMSVIVFVPLHMWLYALYFIYSRYQTFSLLSNVADTFYKFVAYIFILFMITIDEQRFIIFKI